ncbi:MAG: HypC/HybG/HupF family hydrogenase formation chaperone [Thaumarchaeota archaeon]|nr:MAG: HypC/HybG/HupF family hydrogenase formation chaperone [Nitrososphaerota archaeon]
MCLGIPARVVEVRETTAIVDYGGYLREVDIILQPNIKVGDYVIVHAGTIIAKIDEKEALETIKLWKELLKVSIEK